MLRRTFAHNWGKEGNSRMDQEFESNQWMDKDIQEMKETKGEDS